MKPEKQKILEKLISRESVGCSDLNIKIPRNTMEKDDDSNKKIFVKANDNPYLMEDK